MDPLIITLLFLLGTCVGSFLNVLIYRIPKGEEFVKTPSHCMTCGHPLKWYELVPVVSWLAQGGKCRACGVKLSAQYPIVETLNGIMWLLTGILFRGDWLTVGLYCGLFSMLLVLSVIDWREFIIPNGINLVIFLLGVVRLVTDLQNWLLYLIGMAYMAVSIGVISDAFNSFVEEKFCTFALTYDVHVDAIGESGVDTLLQGFKVQGFCFGPFGNNQMIFRLNCSLAIPPGLHPRFSSVTFLDRFQAHYNASQSSIARR